MKLRDVLLAALLSSAMGTAAYAGGPFSGSVTGSFSDPVLSGTYVDTNGSLVAEDDTTSAVFSVTTTTSGSSVLSWGDEDPSTLTFLEFPGAGDFSNVPANTLFHLGTIIYHNGTSDLNSVIFGATLNLDTGGATDPFSTSINLVTTANTGISPARDSDFVGFGTFDETFNVYEGATSSIELYGMIVGDPQLNFTQIEISPVAAGSGFIGNGVGPVPEPASWAMMLVGFGGLGVAMRMSRRAKAAAATA